MEQGSQDDLGKARFVLGLLTVAAALGGCAGTRVSAPVLPAAEGGAAAQVQPGQAVSSPFHLELARGPGATHTTVFAVVDPEGERVPGALIDVWLLEREPSSRAASGQRPRLDLSPLEGPPHHQLITSGADGMARVTLARGQTLALRAEREDIGATGYVVPGHRWEGGELVPHASKQGALPFWESLRLRTPGRLHGRLVAADGQPAAGATVRVTSEPPLALGSPAVLGRDPGDVVTDAEGRFELVFDAQTRISLSSGSPEHPFESGLLIREGALVEATFYADGARFVSGRVLDEQGQPVEGVALRALHDFGLDSESLGTTPFGEARSDADGRFRLPLARDGACELLASKQGWMSREPVLLRVEHGVPLEELSVPLVPSTAIRGIVLSADGEAVAGLRVSASPAVPILQRISPSHFWMALLRGTETGPDGSFTLSDIHSGQDYTVTVRPSDLQGPRLAEIAQAHWSPGDDKPMVLQLR